MKSEERREKIEERREKREERRERREERREKREERRETKPNEAARGPKRGPERPLGRRYGTEKGRPLGGKREESREKREERREKRENGRQLDSLHFYGVPCPPQRSYENQQGPPKLPQARFTPFLQCPVTTSMRAPKTPTSVRGSVSQKF